MSVIALPKYEIEVDGRLMTADEAATRLHFKKNQPERPDIDFPPYQFRPFPTCVYREWSESAREREVLAVAGRLSLDLEKRADLARAAREVAEYESRQIGVEDHPVGGVVNPQLRARNVQELAQALENGWAETPDGVKGAKDRINKAVALAAAHRAYDDRHLGEQAQRELDAIEATADNHVVDVPIAPKKRGRKPKHATEAA